MDKVGQLAEKMVKDPIHGYVDIHPLGVAIIDTPEFQRLRDVSQLGGVYYVFGGATGRRFEHSLGVAHLARRFVKQLKMSQPELAITDQDELCVHLAGLIHDIGHGPFSHLFDGKFIKKIVPSTRWVHEHASISMFDLLIERNNLLPQFEHFGLTTADIHFIKELVLGSADDAPPSFQWRGRGPKDFLYEIVSNHATGIDVDKFDYFSRDCYTLGINKSFDAERLMRCAKVYEVDGVNRICFEKKELWNVYELFHTRYSLHKRAYQHRVSSVVEFMLTEALEKANDHFLFESANGSQTRMSEAINDMSVYCQLSDWIFQAIQHSTSQQLKESRNLIHRVRTRNLFSFVGQVLLSGHPEDSLDRTNEQEKIRSALTRSGELTCADLLVSVVEIGYGKGAHNPVDSTLFFTHKTNGAVGIIDSQKVSQVLPRHFHEYYARVWCRDDSKVTLAQKQFEYWCSSLGLPSDALTPVSKQAHPPSTTKRCRDVARALYEADDAQEDRDGELKKRR